MRTLGAIAVGFAAGTLSGAVGVGGAVVSTPGIRLLGAPPIIAVGSTVPAIIPAALTGSVNYVRHRLVNFPVAVAAAAAGLPATIGGAYTSDYISGHLLMLITAGLVAENSVRMYRDARRMRADERGESAEEVVEPHTIRESGRESGRSRNPIALGCAIGIFAGFVSGLLGIGGGVIMVPAFYRVVKLEVKETVATSLLVVGVLAIPGVLSHWHLGHIDWSIALPLAAGVIPGAWVGSRFTVEAGERRLRYVISVVLGVVAVVYGTGEAYAMFSG